MKLVLVSALLLVLSTITVDGAAVYDVYGNIVRPYTPYYIVPSPGNGGGGLFPLFRQRICIQCQWCCPMNVAQKSSNLDKGHPVLLSFFDPSKISDFSRIIEFYSPPPDGGSPVWKLDSADPSNGQRYVTLNGSPNNTITTDNRFKIEEDDFGYKMLSCPYEAEDVCSTLGIHYEDEDRWLALSDNPLYVNFVPV